MSLQLAALSGWACAGTALLALTLARLRADQRMALVAEASHELRGPLTALQLGLASLARDAAPEGARRAAALDLELRRAGLALEDLAAAPGGRRADDRLGSVDVADLLQSTAQAWAPVAEAMGCGLTVQVPEQWWVVRADRARLAQALGNLVANAIEHGEGAVELRARGEGDGARVCLEVLEQGAGLPCGRDRRRANLGRRGHGLAVARRVAQRSGGSLRSEARRPGHAMVLELPAADAPLLARVAPPVLVGAA